MVGYSGAVGGQGDFGSTILNILGWQAREIGEGK